MITNDIGDRLFYLGDIQIKLRHQIGVKKAELKALEQELKRTEKEMFALRSTEEYEKYIGKIPS